MIGYYIHHHGNGHLNRARAIVSAIVAEHPGLDVTIFSTLPPAGFGRWHPLPADDEPGIDRQAATAGGQWHWAPQDSAGHRRRMAVIAQWVADHPGAVLISDVSAEVAVLGRLLGARVVVIAQPGDRTDRPHDQAYGSADLIIAPWPRALYEPDWLSVHNPKVHWVGGISGLDPVTGHGRRDTADRQDVPGHGAGVDHGGSGDRGARRQLSGQRPVAAWLPGTEGGWSDAELDRARAATPGWEWIRGRGLGACELSALLTQAQLAVGISGLGTVADLALLSVPAILRPAPRPFDEQAVTAGVLADHALATIVTEPVTDWAAVVRRTIDRPDRWSLWQAAGAPQRAAASITGLLGGR